MNSTYRGAVEIFNLVRNLHPHDVLFAECIRTFSEYTIDGRAWLYRLDAAHMTESLKKYDLRSYIPPTRRPNVRTNRSRVNESDAYGLRPLCHPWKLLSCYEFFRQWRIIPLLVPTYYLNRNEKPHTEWTEQGLRLMKSEEYKAGNVVAKPGLHFIAVESESDEYHLYPEEPAAIFQVFRHSWALARKKRPQVIVIEGLKLPNTNRPASYNAQYCSLFFRPWTLLEGDLTVPHLSLLGVDRKSLQVIYEQQIKSPLKAAKYGRCNQ